jgi:hypothetical protein
VVGSFWSQEVLTSYLPTSQISTPLGQSSPGADLGTVNERTRQNLLVLTPTATFDLSPRQHLDVQVQYLDVDYTKIIPNEVQDFQSFNESVGLGFATSSQTTLSIRGVAAEFRPTSGSDANTYGAEGGWDTHLTELMHAYAKLGVERTSFEAIPNGKTPTANLSGATSWSGGAGISRKFVTYDLFADFSRSVSANSVGAVVARDDLRLRLEHEFSARYLAYAGLRGIDQTALGNSAEFTSQRYGQAALGFEWRMYRQFSIISEYAYTSLKDGNLPHAAGSNAVTVSLRYEPHRPAEQLGVDIGR